MTPDVDIWPPNTCIHIYTSTQYIHTCSSYTHIERWGERENESDRQRHKTFPLVDTSTEIS